jgi:lysophospholipase L1-like esterase
MIKRSRLLEGNETRLAEKLTAAAGNDITVAFIGGSITQRFSAEADECYAYLVYDWFRQTFPSSKTTSVNCGVGATGSYIGVHRADTDLLAHQPDIVFVEFSVNDTDEDTERNMAAYDSLLRKIWRAESRPAIITIAMTEENGDSFQDYHYEIVKAYDIPMISYREAVLPAIANGEFRWADISDDDIHPNKNGHGLLAGLVTAYLEDMVDIMPTVPAIVAIRAEDDSHTADHAGATDHGHTADDGCAADVIPPPYTAAPYVNATLVRPPLSRLVDEDFGNMQGYAVLTDELLTFTVHARYIGILYSKLTENGGRFAIYIDGKEAATLSADFSDGWGDYAEGEEVFAADIVGEHTVELCLIGGGEVYVTGLAVG